MSITRDTVNYSSSPIGFEFTSKRLTERAQSKLSSYWINILNAREAKEEYLNLMNEGNREYLDLIQWHTKYSLAYQRCEWWLTEQRFIRKIKI